jgi:hypothetical protein
LPLALFKQPWTVVAPAEVAAPALCEAELSWLDELLGEALLGAWLLLG